VIRCEKGFTLIESLVALLVISISMLALASLLIGNMKSTTQSERKIDYSGLAQSAMNNMVALVKANGTGYTQANAQTALTAQMANVTDLYSAAVTLNPTPTVQGTTAINVQFSWMIRGDTKTLTLRSAVVTE